MDPRAWNKEDFQWYVNAMSQAHLYRSPRVIEQIERFDPQLATLMRTSCAADEAVIEYCKKKLEK